MIKNADSPGSAAVPAASITHERREINMTGQRYPGGRRWAYLLLVLLCLAVCPPAFSQTQEGGGPQIVGIVVPPSPPPPGYVPSTRALTRLAGDVILDGAPAFTWCYGCSATSAGMMMGYYDRHGYPNMYTGPANGGVCPLNNEDWWGHTYYASFGNVGECPFVASHKGIDNRATGGHVEDYWGEPDPCVVGNWTPHADDCTADFMGTSQDRYGNTVDGSTMFYYDRSGAPLVDYQPTSGRDGCHGMRLYAEAHGYTVTTNYTQVLYDSSAAPSGFTFDQYCAEIDAGYPVLIQLNGHTMLGVGYNKTNSTVYIHNTWSNSMDSMTWGGSYQNMAQWGVTVFHLSPQSAVNNPPTLDAIADQMVAENSDAHTVNLTGISAGGSTDTWQSLTITAASSNPTLIPTPTISYTNPSTTGILTFKPATNQFGTAMITVTVRDNGGTAGGGVDTTTQLFAIDVKQVNVAPTLNALPNLTLNENAGVQVVNLTGISPGPATDAGQAITITAYSNNLALIPQPLITYTSPAATGTLAFQPVAESTGTAIITIVVQDDGGTADGGVDTTIRVFNVTVNMINNPPTIDPIPDMTIKKSAGLQTINLTGISAGDPANSGQVVTFVATSSNTALIPTPSVYYLNPSSTGTLSFTPVANKTGSAVITLTVQDTGGTANGGVDTTVRKFTISVVPVNDAPAIKAVANLTVNENSAAKTISLSGISGGLFGQVVSITATSSNPALIPDPTVNYTSPKSTGTLTFTPVPHTFGTAVITLTVHDNGGTAFGGVDTTTRTFTVKVNAVNEAPTLDAIPNQQQEDDGQVLTIPLTGVGPGGAGEEDGQILSVSATSSNTLLVPKPLVNGSGTTWALELHPIAGKYGAVTIAVTVKDNGGIANGGKNTTKRTFTVTLLHHQPDLWVKNAGDTAYSGKAVYNTDGTKQTKTQAIAAGAAAIYYFGVKNAGTTADTFTINNLGDTTGWAVQYYLTDATGKLLTPLTDDFTTGWSTGSIAAGQAIYLKAVVTCTDPAAAPCTLQLAATSTANPARQDVVKAVTTRK